MNNMPSDRRARLGAIESANRMVLSFMEGEEWWGDVLPPPAFTMLMFLTTPIGLTEDDLHKHMSVYVANGLDSSIWEKLPIYSDPDDPDTKAYHARVDPLMVSTRAALPRYTAAVRVAEVRTYRDLLRFAIAAGLVFHVADGLMMNPAPPRPAEVLAHPKRVTEWHRQL